MENQIGWWLPLNISAHGAGIDQLINVVHIFMLVLFVGWGAFFVYCLIRFRSRSGHKAETQIKHFKVPMYLEIGILLFEIFLLVFLSSPIWYEVKTAFPAEKDALVVNILAEQFAWNIHYPGKDGKFGPTKPELMDGTNPIGLDRSHPDGVDDIFTINNFHTIRTTLKQHSIELDFLFLIFFKKIDGLGSQRQEQCRTGSIYCSIQSRVRVCPVSHY